MKRITLVLGVVAVMVAMLVALAAPAMAKDNGGNHNNGDGTNNRVDNDLGRLDNGLDNRADLDEGSFFVRPVPPVITEPVDTAIVEPDDTLFGLAQEHLGPAARPELIPDEVNRIHDLNRDVIGDNPHMIFPGQHLRMP